MLNMLIIDDNLNCAKILVSSILKENSNIRLLDIAVNGEEAIKIVSNNKVDIILLDLKMPKMNGNEFLQWMSKKNLVKDNSIIVITGEDKMLQKIIKNPLVYSYSLKPIKQQYILKKVSDLTDKIIAQDIDTKLDNHILKELKYLGYNLSHCGTKYLLECIKIDYIKYSGEAENINKQIYPIISKKYNKSSFTIKNNIIKATNYMYAECEENKLLEYFKYVENQKPTPKMIIKTIIRKI